MTLIYAYQNRGITRNIVIKDTNDVTITPDANDKIRAIIQRANGEVQLTVTSGTNTANGSSFVKGATNVLRLDAADLAFEPGAYTLIIDYYDYDDAQEWKTVSRQVFVLEGT